MKTAIRQNLERLEREGNKRIIPHPCNTPGLIDFSSNDYLGIATDKELRREFFDNLNAEDVMMSASASRLLAHCQEPFADFEATLKDAYHREALIFNSGYHANVGLVSALATGDCTIIADKLVHASIIDGIKLSGAPFERFRHNDMRHLSTLAKKVVAQGRRPLIIVESVYSMDGDKAPLDEIADIKKGCPGALLYVDEAHAVGVEGPSGLGMSMSLGKRSEEVDIIIGTLGKALGSTGAYAMTGRTIRDWAVNKARSLIFSTALPPINVMWSKFIFLKSLEMDARRIHLKKLGKTLGAALGSGSESHIQPFMIGDPHSAVRMSEALRRDGFEILPIRTPTVPPGTDRLRISLSASMNMADVEGLAKSIKSYRDE